MVTFAEIPLYLPRHTCALLLLLAPLAAPGVAAGQQNQAPGIDLTEPRREPPSPGVARGSSNTAAGAQAPLAPGEGDVAFADRVKAVQRKGFLKRHRLELGLDLPATLNDPFYEKVGVGAKVAYNLDESFAVALRGT